MLDLGAVQGFAVQDYFPGLHLAAKPLDAGRERHNYEGLNPHERNIATCELGASGVAELFSCSGGQHFLGASSSVSVALRAECPAARDTS
jgi:hypothetical protein